MKKQNILIVDDESTNVSLLAKMLDEKYNFLEAKDGATALEIANSDEKIDLILLDAMMPDMDGYEVAHQLKNNIKTSKIPFIFLTAKIDTQSIVKGFQAGAVDYISKPYIKEELLARVHSHLHKSYNELFNTLEATKIAEEKLRLALEGAGDGVWDWNIKTNDILYSSRWKEMLGFKEDDITRNLSEWEERVHPQDIKQAIADLSAHVEGKTDSYRNEHRIKCKDDSYKWVLARGVIVSYDLDGSPLRMVGLYSDISEQKLTEMMLYESQEKYHAVFNGTLDGIIVLELKTKKFVDVNVTMCQMMGYSHEEFLRLSVSDLHLEENLPYVLEQFEKMIKSELLITTDLPVQRKDGSIFFADINAARINVGGQDYIMGVFRDITDRKRAEQALHDSEEMMLTQSKQAAMGEMISMIAHQWRQPLNIIGLAVANIQTKQALGILDEKSIEDNGVIISDNIAFMSDTIDDFRNYFKPDAPREQTTIQEIIDIVFKIIGKNLENNEISFNVVNNKTSNLFIHKSSLVQVLLNIIGNAKDALISNKITGASINVTINETQDSVVLKICDNAGGISEDILDKIHKPYFSTKSVTGTGLGLYISCIIVEKHLLGTFTWHNGDKGACFTIILNLK